MIDIVRADLDDAQIITETKIKAYNKEINTYLGRDGGPVGYNQVESHIKIINKYIAYKILLDKEIIGAFFLIPISDTQMRFEDFVINPSYQGNGYGTAVMGIVENRYPKVKEWHLSTPVFSLSNQHLYEKLGYIEIDRNAEEIEYIKKMN